MMSVTDDSLVDSVNTSGILDSLTEHVVLYDRDLTIRWLNAAARRSAAERGCGDPVGRRCYTIWQCSGEPCADCPALAALRTGRPQSREMETPDGRTWLVRGNVTRDAEGRVSGMVEATLDITVRKDAEKKQRERRAELEEDVRRRTADLRASEGKLDAMLKSLPDHISMMDRDLTILWANDTARRHFGQEIIGRKCYEVYHRRDTPCRPAPCLTLKAFEDGHVHEHDTSVIMENGERRFFHCASNVALRDEQGRPTAVLEVSRDITEQKQSERETEHSRNKYQSLVANMPGITYRCKRDRDWTMLYMSAQVEPLTGYPASDFIHNAVRTYESVIHRDDSAYVGRAVNEAADAGEPWEIEYRVVHRDGTVRWAYEKGRAIPGEDGETQFLDGFILDVTERRKAEEELEALNAELKRSNRDLQDFTHVVSHDLQEPLRKVHTFCEFLVEDCADQVSEEGRRHIERMQDAVLRMKQLIKHLLTLSRVDTRGAELRPVDAGEVVASALETLDARVAEAGARVHVDDPLPRVFADAVQLRQLFENLVGNALKYRSTEREPEVRVAAEVDNGWATFSVRDNGIGIDRQYLKKIFGVFQRLHPRDRYEGTGVGLALCRKIVRRHGGRIHAESTPGEGSTFYFTLRRAP
jgi:PAS domain S-box-containing protein